jgi:hypothetical protein
MKTPILLIIGLAASAALGWGQTKFTATGKCDKPETQQSIDVGDRTGHALVLVKQTCSWTAPVEMEGLKSSTYVVNSVSDVSGTKGQDTGYVVITMDNGDKAFVRFRGASTLVKDGPGTGEGTWSYTGGTGKLRGLTGKGTYKSASGEDQIEGEYTITAPKAKK